MNKNFIDEIVERFKKPWNSAFLGYFILIIIIFGGFGILFALYDVLNNEVDDGVLVAQNIATYFMAILASSIIDLNLSWSILNRVSTLLYSFLFFIVGLLLMWLTYKIQSDIAFIPAIIGCIISWIVWILANADNEKLNDENFYKAMKGEGHGNNWQEA
ncbi:MAG: hypothetical protein K2Q22_08490 [Cytophagales bacterium]|nr:hypothetical protein [Cytophagales bacterium]